MVYHFMFSPEWDEGCKICSFCADYFDAAGVHLNQRDVTLVAIARAPLAKIERFRRRMGWRFKWLSSSENSFNYDYRVSFTPEKIRRGTVVYNYHANTDMPDREGLSVFYQDAQGRCFTPTRPTPAASTW